MRFYNSSDRAVQLSNSTITADIDTIQAGQDTQAIVELDASQRFQYKLGSAPGSGSLLADVHGYWDRR